MKPDLKMMTIPLKISAVLYCLVAGICFLFGIIMFMQDVPKREEFAAVFGGSMMFMGVVFSIAFGIFIMVFTKKLEERKRWAWICSIIFGAMYIPSIFFFLGLPIIIKAFDPIVMKWFNEPVS